MKETLTLYHGSPYVINVPMPGKGNANNDYGRGFYCTKHFELAGEWSCRGQEIGVVNEYALDIDGLSVLNLSGKGYHILNWLSILLENRSFDVSLQIPLDNRAYFLSNFLPDYKEADVIVGYRADDSYFSYAKDFLDNTITLAQLQTAMKLGRLGEQVVIKSAKAFDGLQFIKAHAVDGDAYLAKRISRDTRARSDYRAIRDERFSEDYVLASDIVRQNWKNDDSRLR